jgi:hypothetical protein
MRPSNPPAEEAELSRDVRLRVRYNRDVAIRDTGSKQADEDVLRLTN